MVLPWPITDMSDQDERIEELESKVERLEATIQGLTEELVEVHDRLETLEGEDASPDERERTEDARTQKDKNDDSKSNESQKEDETGDDSELGDDIIVA